MFHSSVRASSMHLALLLVSPHVPLDHYRDKDNLQAASCQSKLPWEKPYALLEDEEGERWKCQKREKGGQAENKRANFKRCGSHGCGGVSRLGAAGNLQRQTETGHSSAESPLLARNRMQPLIYTHLLYFLPSSPWWISMNAHKRLPFSGHNL